MATGYAQTGAQLLSQLERDGYSAAEQRLVGDAYRLAAELFADFWTGRGRSQLAHVVGTASIVSNLRAPATLVAAALIHNAYETGDFGRGRPDASWRARWRVRRSMGTRVARHVRRFRAIKHLAAGTRFASAGDREVVLIVLADWLEHQSYGEWAPPNGALLADRADELGFPALAAEMRSLHVATTAVC